MVKRKQKLKPIARRPQKPTDAPSRAKAIAAARPIPEVTP